MERSADHSTTEPATDGTDGDQTETAPDRTDTGAELAQLEDRWRRALADLDNLRKRYAKDLDRERAAETARVSAAWLPVLDNLELALAHAGSDPQTVVDGVKAIRDQAVQILSRLGFERHDEVGLRFPVQYVIRPRTPEHPDYRGYAGQIAAGRVSVGDEVVVLPSGQRTTVSQIDTADGQLATAHTGRSVTLLLADDVDISRGDLIAAVADAPEPIAQFTATVCWLAEKPLRIGARLLLKHGTKTTQAIVGALDALFDEQNLALVPAPESVELNQIVRISVQTAEPIPADDYQVNRESGSFLLIDPQGGNTLAAGLVGDALAPLHLKELV